MHTRRCLSSRPPAIRLGLVVGIAALLVPLVLAGCGESTGQAVGVATPTWTPFVMPTPRPTNTPRPIGDLCTNLGQFATPIAISGDLSFTAVSDVTMFPQLKLPDGQPLKPMQVNGPIDSAQAAHYPVANDTLFSFSICNTSKTTAHSITGVTIKVNSFAAYGGQLNVTQVCASAYSRQGPAGEGCGGGQGAELVLKATLGSSAVGTTTQATSDDITTFPMEIAPGYAVSALLTIKPPSTPGTFSYKAGFAVDGAATVYPVPATAAILEAPVAHMWDGGACTTSAMQALIPPATNPPTFYICPQM